MPLGGHARSREYSEAADFLGGGSREPGELAAGRQSGPAFGAWFYAFPERLPAKRDEASLYNAMRCVQALMLARHDHAGAGNNSTMAEGVPKMTEIHRGFSREATSVAADDPNAIQSGRAKAGTGPRLSASNAALCLAVATTVVLLQGFAGDPCERPRPRGEDGSTQRVHGHRPAAARRFASMDAEECGGVTTRPLTFDRGRACS
jgi:hypothetical protein